MAQTNYTPILIYGSTTATNVPLAADLTTSANGVELAINAADGKLFYKDSGGVVQVLATKGGVGTSTTTQVLYNSAGLVVGSANLTFNGTTLTAAALVGPLTGNVTGNVSGTALNVTGVVAIANGGTGQTTLAAASIATYAGTETLTNKRINPRIVSVTTAPSIAPSVATADQYVVTALAETLTISAPTGTPTDGNKLIFRILDNGTPRSLLWDSTYTVVGVTLPTTTVANKIVYVGCIYNTSNTRWDVIATATQA